MQDGRRERLSIEQSTLAGLRPVLDVVRQIGRETSIEDALTRILTTMISACKAARGSILTFSGDTVKSKLSLDRNGRQLHRDDKGVSRAVLKAVRHNHKRVVTANARTDPSLRLVDTVHRLRLTSILCVPLRFHDRVIGAFYLDDPDAEGVFGPHQVEIAEVLADHAAIAIENARLHDVSVRDKLTRVFNHGYFEKRLAQELEFAGQKGRRVGLLMIDVDDFKGINDGHGHEAGNQVLKHLADGLSSTVRAHDLVARAPSGRKLDPTVARFGGDEFEIILPGTGPEGTLRAGQRLVEALGGNRLRAGSRTLQLSISVGGAVFPDHAKTAKDLQARADEALYASKRAGKNRAAIWSRRSAP
jgi:diguanylate cyclase (GGDEF)-like protein